MENKQRCVIHDVTSSTHLLVIRDWTTPYNSNMKGNWASAEYWASKLGKDTETFIKDFKNGRLDSWFKVYCP
jgi:hypothetical protein